MIPSFPLLESTSAGICDTLRQKLMCLSFLWLFWVCFKEYFPREKKICYTFLSFSWERKINTWHNSIMPYYLDTVPLHSSSYLFLSSRAQGYCLSVLSCICPSSQHGVIFISLDLHPKYSINTFVCPSTQCFSFACGKNLFFMVYGLVC